MDRDNGVTTADSKLQVITFMLGKEEYAVPILQIQEINRLVEITKVPRSPEFVEGVINLRGKVIPVVDLRKRFGLPETAIAESSRIVVVNISRKLYGLIVDSVSGVLHIPQDGVETPPGVVVGIDTEYIRGIGQVGEKLIILLDINKVLTVAEIQAISQG